MVARRVFDCFIYNGESQVLEIRLNELNLIVDRFVLVEADTSFSGNPKPIFFNPHDSVFAAFAHKIDHIVVRDMPCTDDPWERETWQRNAMLRGVAQLADADDLVLMSDVDEIPRATIVSEARDDIFHEIFLFRLSLYYFFVDFKNVTGPEIHTIWNCAALYKHAVRIQPQNFRKVMLPGARVFEHAGWHFSYLTNDAGVRRKIAAFSHQELNNIQVLGSIDIPKITRSGADLFDRPGYTWCAVEEGDLPEWIQHNRAQLPQLFCREAQILSKHYEFTSDWFSANVPAWRSVLGQVGQQPNSVLEIGSYEGRSTVWIIENIFLQREARIVTIDTWSEGPEPDQREMLNVEERFDRNIALARHRHPNVQVEKLKGPSTKTLSALISAGKEQKFDMIYVDGSHKAPEVLADLVLAFQLCKIGGLIFCDDYLGAMDRELAQAPKIAIDSFFACFHRKLEIIPERLYQMYFRKTSN